MYLTMPSKGIRIHTMNKLLVGIVIIQTLLFIAFGGFFLFELSKLLKVEQPIERVTKFDVVKFCQEMSAKKTDEDWGYKSCLEEMEKAAKEDLLGGVEKI